MWAWVADIRSVLRTGGWTTSPTCTITSPFQKGQEHRMQEEMLQTFNSIEKENI